MKCYSKDQLKSYLLEECAAEAEPVLVEHLNGCATCRQALDDLSDDNFVRDHFEAMRRDEEAGLDTDAPRDDTASGGEPDSASWLTFMGDDTQLPLEFGKFLLKRILGAGGFATVYLADDVDLGREVAVKIPHLGRLSPDLHRRFMREGVAAAALHHPNIVPVLQAGEHRGLCFLVSEYIAGTTLRQFLIKQDGRCNPELAARLVLPLADAVEHAHQSHVVHRDIKPSNVILDARVQQNGLPFRPMLTDFGTARLVDADHSATISGMLIGTAPYMAPEQVRGGDVGPSCDVYGLGALLFELIAGRPSIQGVDNADTLHQVLTADPPDLCRLVLETPRDLGAICMRCLEKDPGRRYSSAANLALDLQRFLHGEPTAARPLGVPARLVRWGRRNPLPLTIMATITAMLMLIVGGLVGHTAALRDVNERLTLAGQQALDQRDRAEKSEARVRRLLYASDLRLAEKAWRDGDLRTVRDLLRRYVPAHQQADLRGIEWYFLDRAMHPPVKTIAETGSALYCIRFSPDGESFVTAGADGVIRVFARDRGDLLQSIDSGQVEVNDVAFSPDGRMLASAGDDGSVCLWRMQNGEPLRRIDAHDGLAFGVEFAQEGRRLISCGRDARVRVWDAATGQMLKTYEDHRLRVEAITVSPDGRWLASVGKDGLLVVRDTQTGELGFHEQVAGRLSAIDFSPDSTLVAIVESGGSTKWLRVFDIAAKALVFARQHPDGIRSVAFSSTGDFLLTADDAGTARIWELASDHGARVNDEPLEVSQMHSTRLYAATFERHGDSILAAGENGKVTRWSWRHVANEVVWEDHKFPGLHDVSFASNSVDVLVAHNGGIAAINSFATEDIWYRQGKPGLFSNHVAVSPRGDWFVVAASTTFAASEQGLLRPAVIERWANERPRRVLLETEANYVINDLSISPTGKFVSVVMMEENADNEPKQLLLLDSETGDVLQRLPAAAGTKARFTPDGRRLIFGLQRDIHAFDTESQEVQVVARDAHTHSQSGLAISANGKWLATCDEGREIKLWSLPSFEPRAELLGHRGAVSAILFSPDSHTLLSSSHDGTVKAWSVLAGRLLMNIHLGDHGVSHIALSPDGRRLAVIEDRRRLRIYAIGA